MKTIIHIGQHKTGTTSIQNFLQDNKKLLSANGLYVPSKIAGYRHPSHFALNVHALAENRYSSKKENLLATKGADYINGLERKLRKDISRIYADAEKRRCDRLIWSNEGLYLLNTTAEYQRLASLFLPHSTEIAVVCCFRDVKSYRESYINQLKKQKIGPSDNSDSYRYLEPDSWLFDYERKKKLLSAVFDSCIYFPYDPIDNVSRFMDSIDMHIDGMSSYRLNVTAGRRKQLTRLQRIKKALSF